MAFENLGRLEDQLDELRHRGARLGNTALERRIVTFAAKVYEEMDLAFTGVDGILQDIENSRPDQVNEKFVSNLLSIIDYSHSREKFKIVLEVCDRLSELATKYKKDIDEVLGGKDQHFSELFYLLENMRVSSGAQLRTQCKIYVTRCGTIHQAAILKKLSLLLAQLGPI